MVRLEWTLVDSATIGSSAAPALGVAKRRIGARLGSSATAGEGKQNLLCAYLAIAVLAGLAANTLRGAAGWTAWSRWSSLAGQ